MHEAGLQPACAGEPWIARAGLATRSVWMSTYKAKVAQNKTELSDLRSARLQDFRQGAATLGASSNVIHIRQRVQLAGNQTASIKQSHLEDRYRRAQLQPAAITARAERRQSN